ncbi:oxygen-independent coproporphyrinogen IIIoxidase [Striga asiatica]|uniref:Radical S-adenosyl methionine domain-containing protein 1, mitochondrial n=1 Tax=Striga asiatica TaxID=4170 RepID=A0A5A7QC99_STRAF|nr:oxygen-independent coproporphyrinogen IIIoxidase [Striga asiatica]
MLVRSSTFIPSLSAAITARTANSYITRRRPARQNATAANTNTSPPLSLLHQLPPKSAYVHLPFCRRRCHYCDFPIIALGSDQNTSGRDDPRISSYIGTLCREIEATASSGQSLGTVFLGGGTPSLVPPRLVRSVLSALSAKFGVRADAEISMEMDPGTFDDVALRDLMGFGVNRVSLGVQAFQDELLSACGRAHGLREVREAIEIVRSCGVPIWSLDLISSLPHQTPAMWAQSLRLAIEAGPTHISVYDLQVERDTKFGALYSPGEFPLPSENMSAEFYRMASGMLREAGYEHYEISSYCKPGYRCKHNSTYWRNEPYYAFGLGSASFLRGVRFSRPRRLKDYVDYVKTLEDGSTDCVGPTDAKDLAMDVVMLSLRTADGLDLRRFREAFGDSVTRSICEVYTPHVESGHVIFLDEQEKCESIPGDGCGFIRLSDPDGFLLSNELISLAFGAISP